MTLYRYSRWDGAQEVFPIDADDLMGQLSEQLMSHGDLSSALRSMLQKGMMDQRGRRLTGVQEILERLRRMRQQSLEKYNIDSVLQGIEERLREIETLEREGIDRRLEEVRQRHQNQEAEQDGLDSQQRLVEMMERLAQRNQEFLDGLPPDPAGKIKQLRDYEFMDAEAKAKFDELLTSLQKGVGEQYFRDLSQNSGGLTPEAMDSLRQMLQDLNEMLERRIAGEDPGLEEFMDTYGDMFGPNRPSTLEELVEGLQQRMAQVESLLKSMSPESRRQLQELTDSILKDQSLRDEIAQLMMNLEALHPMEELRRNYPFLGEESVALDEAMELMEQLQEMDELERQLRRTQQNSNLAEVDSQLLEEVMGQEAAQEMEHLKGLTQLLEEAGYVQRIGNRLELTPKGIRRIGQNALQEVFACIKGERVGTHTTRFTGQGGERLEETRKYEYGDALDLHLQKSIMNAITRQSSGVPVRFSPEDFEVYRSEEVTRSSTVLMVDLSLSMAMRGNFLAAKRVALALDNLIRTQFPRDDFYIVGFSTYAREVKPDKLAYLNWDEFDPYTNIQHGLIMAQKLLSKTSGGTRQVIMISDGEPTAHIESGQLFLQYPPSPRTLRETLREVKRCTSKGIRINTFMLDRSAHLVEFVEQMTRINRGRVFYTSPERLGQYILVDYFSQRRKVLA